MLLKISKALALIATLVVVGCTGVNVSTDYDTGRDFSSLKTYAWLEPNQKLVVDPLVDNDLMVGRIQRSVDAELRALGYVKASAAEGADFFVTYHVSAEDKISINSFRSNFGYYPCWGCFGRRGGHGFGGGNDIQVRQYKQGTFMLDVVDPASKQLMWRGVAGKRLTSGSPHQRDDYVQVIVNAILAKFPPGGLGAS